MSIYLDRDVFFTRNIFFLIGIVSLFCRNVYHLEGSCGGEYADKSCETVNNNNAIIIKELFMAGAVVIGRLCLWGRRR